MRLWLNFVVVFLIIVSLAVPVSAAGGEGELSALFLQAARDYQQGEFAAAVEGYKALSGKVSNGYIYFNLGNCYLKMDEIGRAILNYRRARRYIPRFPDLLMNLNYAARETKDKIEETGYGPVLRAVFFWYDYLSKREMLWIFLACNVLFFSLASLRLFFFSEALKWLLLAGTVLYVLAFASLAVRIWQDYYVRGGVVLSKEVAVRSGNKLSNVVLFKLHAGAEFEVEEDRGDWLKISLADGKLGWVERKGVGII